jgi:hypothetical protein
MGFAPRRRSAYCAARLYIVEKLTPYDASPPTATYSRNAKLVGSRFSIASCAIEDRPRKIEAVSRTKSAWDPDCVAASNQG